MCWHADSIGLECWRLRRIRRREEKSERSRPESSDESELDLRYFVDVRRRKESLQHVKR